MTRQTIGSGGDAAGGGNVGHNSAHETIHNHDHDGSSVAAPAPTKAKICVVCGTNVAGHRRYKDGAGRYYCEECFSAQTTDNDDGDDIDSDPNISRPAIKKAAEPPPKTTVPCPDCKQEFEPATLVDYHGTMLCEKCADHREKSAKREAARIAAAEEEAARQAERKKMITIVVVVVVGLLALYGVLRLVIG